MLQEDAPDFQPIAQIIDIRAQPKGLNPNGAIVAGRLVLHSYVALAPPQVKAAHASFKATYRSHFKYFVWGVQGRSAKNASVRASALGEPDYRDEEFPAETYCVLISHSTPPHSPRQIFGLLL